MNLAAPSGLPLLPSRPNLRCLGGLETAGGARVRRLRFLRAPALTDMQPEEADWLVRLDPAVVIDFRGEDEVAQNTVGWPEALAVRRLTLPIVSSAGSRFHAVLASGAPSPSDFSAIMVDIYRDFVRVHGETFVAFLQAVAAAGERPVLFHCTAGKDRTGLAAALILTALGVPRAAVVRDYLATADLWRPDERLLAQLPAAVHAAVFGVESAYLDAAFAELERVPGGVQGFVRDALGGDVGHRAFVERHLEPA